MSLSPLPDEPTVVEIRALLLSDGADTRRRFVEALPGEIDVLANALRDAFMAYRRLDRLVGSDTRRAAITAFYFTALNSALSSAQLLLSGYLGPSGQLMRQFGEATAMTLLLSHPQIDTYATFQKDPKIFPYHKALEIVNRERNRNLLGVDGKSWEGFMELTSFYDALSHASFLTVASQFLFSHPGLLALGGEFDSDKLPVYRLELGRQARAALILSNLEAVLYEHLTDKRS